MKDPLLVFPSKFGYPISYREHRDKRAVEKSRGGATHE